MAACTAAGDEDNPTSTPDIATPVVDEPTAVPETAVPPTLEEGVDRLANSEWTLTSFGPVGEETAVMANTDLTLRFAPEGQAGGSGGCNTFSAEYKAEGTSLQIGEIISTLIACTADGVAAQEEAYFDALRSASEFELGDDQLMIFYNNGQNVLNFTEGVSAVESVAPETGMNLELEGVGTAVSSEFVPEATQSNEQMPYWAVYPAHLELTVDEYAHTDSLQEPKLYLYPVDKFREMNETAAQQIMALEELLASKVAPEEMEMLPFLPLFNAQQMIDVKVEMLTFANGRGVRYLTQYGQAAGPINNQELFYTFQGLTEDGAYYVATVFPVAQADLPADLTAADSTFSDGYDQYLAEVEERLETAAPATFTPDLAALDAAVQSIEVTVAE